VSCPVVCEGLWAGMASALMPGGKLRQVDRERDGVVYFGIELLVNGDLAGPRSCGWAERLHREMGPRIAR
jgi:hypothetical protein